MRLDLSMVEQEMSMTAAFATNTAVAAQVSIMQVSGAARDLPAGSSPLAHVDLSLLAHQVGKAAPNTADGGHGVHDLLLAVHVGVEHTQNVLELLSRDQRLCRQAKSRLVAYAARRAPRGRGGAWQLKPYSRVALTALKPCS